MNKKIFIIITLFLLLMIKSNLLFSQSDFNSLMRGMIINNIHSDTINLTILDEWKLPKIDTAVVKEYELIQLDYKRKYGVKSINEAECRFIDFYEGQNYNFLVLIYSPSRAGNGSPTLQFTTTTKTGKVIDRKLVPYYYYVDPGYESTQILVVKSLKSFELITREINRRFGNDDEEEFVLESDKTKKERFIINNGFILSSGSNNSNENKLTSSLEKTESITSGLIIGERIDGPANIRNAVKGKLLFELFDGTLVETTPIKNNWMEVGVYIKITPKQKGDFKILPGTDLYSCKGKLIGKTKDTVGLLFCGKDYGFIMGHTFINNIKKLSIPEFALIEELKNQKRTKNELKNYMENFKFEEDDEGLIPDIKEYFIYQSTIIDPSPRDRITLLFKNDFLIGFVHSREIKNIYYKTYDLVRGHKLTITSNLPEKEIQQIRKKRIQYYNLVD